MPKTIQRWYRWTCSCGSSVSANVVNTRLDFTRLASMVNFGGVHIITSDYLEATNAPFPTIPMISLKKDAVTAVYAELGAMEVCTSARLPCSRLATLLAMLLKG